ECAAKPKRVFAGRWTRLESRGGCATTGDRDAIEAKVDAHDADLQLRLGAAAPASRCSAGKFRHAGRQGACTLRCLARAVALSMAPNDLRLQRCTAKCASKFRIGFAKDEAKGDCHTGQDVHAIDSAIAAFVDDVASELPAVPTTTTTTPATATSSTITLTPTTSTTLLAIVQCCVPAGGSVAGAYLCQIVSASACTLAGGTDFGPGSCVPSPCPAPSTTTVSTTTITTTTVPVPTTSTTTTSTTTTTFITIPCGGFVPACIGTCPGNQICTGELPTDPCTCVDPPSTTTTTSPYTCAGFYPACAGTCPPGKTCTAPLLGLPCGCY
ncbi:MAG TPA: hypothetical protein VKA21_04980, partial [Candidatus Binatia bacterium]|nr:hypothetical protein [Candidatus Binatia bacterium]